MKNLIIIICLLIGCSHDRKEGAQKVLKGTNISNIAKNFYTSLKNKNWKVALSYLEESVLLSESAYEVGNGWCSPHYRNSVVPREEMASILSVLSKVVGESKIKNFDENTYGVSSMGDCEHVWSIKFSSDNRKIMKINIDAKDNLWNSKRTEFK